MQLVPAVSVPRGRSILAPVALIGALFASSPTLAQSSADITGRIAAVFELVLQSPQGPADQPTLLALERRASERRGTISALAYRQVEPQLAAFQAGLPAVPAVGVIGGEADQPDIVLARLPKPRPETAPIVTGSLPPAERETDYFQRFAGSFAGIGEVKRNARSDPNKVNCKLTGAPSSVGVSISGKCGISFISRKVSADIRYDPASNSYSGTYVGSVVGPAKLWGKRRGDAVVLTITWPKPVNGDTKATMTIRNSGDGALTITVTDRASPGGPQTEVTRLALNQN